MFYTTGTAAEVSQLVDYLTYRPKEYAEKYNSRWKNYVEEIDMKSDDCNLLLFQLNSDYHNSSEYKVLWGDAGVAHFHITRKDLKERNFDKAWFYWDCS